MLQKILNLLRSPSEEPLCAPAGVPDWVRDPLAHPDIAAMDSRALGDLPFDLFASPRAAGAACKAHIGLV
ncbi:MAG: hypothetical protein QHC90_23555 [Shinella sp.]|nr:hypothetical protein [Shinella sp.]